MLFASTELVTRIEQAECRLVVDCTHSAALRLPDEEVLVLPIAGGVATFCGPGSPLNKLVGLGLHGPVREDELAAIEQAFARLGAPLQVELSSLADPAVGRMLTERGYALVGFENVLGRALAAPDAASDGSPSPYAEITRISGDDPDALAVWLDAVVTGFGCPDDQGVPSHDDFPREALERVIGIMAGAEGVACYLARHAGQPVAGASLRMHDGVALLCGAATLPAHRRHGVQAALLATRLSDAAAAGCALAVVTTLPGSRSQHNVQRQGFELLHTRAILVREPGG